MKLLARIIVTPQVLAIVCVGIFLFAVLFSMTFGMQTDERGVMSECPFMAEQISVCPMGVFEHIAKWQQFSITLLLSAFILFIVFIRAQNILLPSFAFSLPIQKNKPETKLFNHLVVIFSQGILNPRLYA